MAKTNNSSVWIETGYNLFAEEGLEGLQIERLARIVSLNKSSFYHYFGDFELYCEQLLGLHEQNAVLFLQGLEKAKNIDPDFLHLLIDFKVPVMFQTRLIQTKTKPSFCALAEDIERREDVIIRKMWSDYLGIEDQPELAVRYFDIVRDMFYSRISFKNYNYPFLQELLGEARTIVNQLMEGKEAEPGGALPKR